MIFLVSFFLVVSGLFFTYISVGLVRSQEKQRGFEECERRLEILRRQIRRLRPR
jgi:uncharacterized membrane protein